LECEGKQKRQKGQKGKISGFFALLALLAFFASTLAFNANADFENPSWRQKGESRIAHG